MIAKTKLIVLTMTMAAFSMAAAVTNILLTESAFAAGPSPPRQEKHLVTGKKEILIILFPLITIQKKSH
jgi:hypothetical protein